MQLRQHIRAIRSEITADARRGAGIAAAEIFAQLPIVQQSNTIACYLPLPTEFDSIPLIQAIWRAKKKCYIPVLTDATEKLLLFVEYNNGDSLQANRVTVLEPVDRTKQIAPTELDLVITPLFAFDRQGYRLGTGGGYYDRTFAFKQANHATTPIMLGLAYAAQQVDDVYVEPWDVVLDGIITEKFFLPIA